jgi:hypothetical protein
VTLTHLLASMRDENGRILIAGFYDDVRALTAAERAALAEVPAAEEQLKRELPSDAPRAPSRWSRASLFPR